jgi:hypothetical protein
MVQPREDFRFEIGLVRLVREDVACQQQRNVRRSCCFEGDVLTLLRTDPSEHQRETPLRVPRCGQSFHQNAIPDGREYRRTSRNIAQDIML